MNNAAERRKEENAYVLNRMKNKKDNLCHTDMSAFRWAPRPLTKKEEPKPSKPRPTLRVVEE